MAGHFIDLHNVIDKFSLYLFAISESFLKPHILNDVIMIPGFNLFRNDRLGKDCGGVALYVRSDFRAKVIETSPSHYSGNPEFMFVEIRADQMPALLVAVVYRAPRLRLPIDFWAVLGRLTPFYSCVAVMGDLNINLISKSTPESRHLIYQSEHLDMRIVPFAPTHHTSNSHTWIDHILVSRHIEILSSSQKSTSISAHDLIMVDLDIPSPKMVPKSFEFRDIANLDRASFLRVLSSSYDWNDFLLSDSIDYKIKFFNKSILNSLNKFAPIQKVLVRKRAAPWLTEQIRSLMRLRDRARDRSRRSSELFYRKEFVFLRNQVTKLLAFERSAYYLKLFDSTKDLKKTWRNVRSLGIGGSGKSSLEKGRRVDIDDLSSFFGSWGKSCLPASFQIAPANSLDVPGSVDGGSAGDVSTPCYNLNRTVFCNVAGDSNRTKVFNIPQILAKDLRKFIGYSKSSSVGPDGISRRIVEISLPFTMNFILHMFNFSIQHRIYPSEWKDSFIRPIPKIANPKTCSDYRPIALTCFLSKLLEKIVSVHMINFLETNKRLNVFQSSFRRFMSAETALLKIRDDKLWAADRGMVTSMVLFDFTKAFDTIEHHLLIDKLEGLGFSVSCCEWIRSYLTGRRQRVLGSEGEFSDWVEMSRGVPQGTVFGPLFFICFAGDLPNCLSFSKHMQFADDFLIYLHCCREDLPRAISQINHDILKICNWSSTNYLSLNPSKSKSIIFGSPHIIKSLDLDVLPKIVVGGLQLAYSPFVKNLGVWLENDLSMVKHSNFIAGKIHGILRQLRSSQNCLPVRLRIDLVRSLIFPHINYCSLLFINCPLYIDAGLKRLTNRCLRFIFNLKGAVSITPRYVKIGWLLPNYQRLLFLGKMTYNLLSRGAPHYLSCLLEFKSNIIKRPSRSSSHDLFVPRSKTDFGQSTFQSASAVFWNSLPENIRKSDSITIFSDRLAKYLLNKQSEEIYSLYH